MIEAKRTDRGVGTGMQQALEYAARLDAPFAYSSNGLGFLESDRTEQAAKRRPKIGLPSWRILFSCYPDTTLNAIAQLTL